jgi:hypothetical protein
MAFAAFRAGEAISAGDAVYVNSSSLLFKGSGATLTEASIVGVAIDGGAVGQLLRVNLDGVYDGLSGLTPGEYQYLSVTVPGAIVNYDTWVNTVPLLNLDPFLTRVGRALKTDAIEVEIAKPVTFVNSTQILLLESSGGIALDALLQEDGSLIDLEVA